VLASGIDGAVPHGASMEHSSPPPALSNEDLRRVLAAVDETSVAGASDRALLLPLTRLDLRRSDVARRLSTRVTGAMATSASRLERIAVNGCCDCRSASVRRSSRSYRDRGPAAAPPFLPRRPLTGTTRAAGACRSPNPKARASENPAR
jgi:hypothetical protein